MQRAEPMSEPSKPAVRAALRAARDGFVLDLMPGDRACLERRAAGYLASLIDGAACVAFYHAVGSELDCGPAIAAAARRGIRIALPHVERRDSPMRFLAWSPGERLEAGWQGLVQPCADAAEIIPDIIVAPLLGFDSALARLGQGGGFYDRAFAMLPAAKKIGLGWSIQQHAAIACDPWDMPLDAVVTEAGVLEGTKAQ